MRELTVSQLVAIAAHSDTGSYNRLDLIQSLVPPHYVCNGYIHSDPNILLRLMQSSQKKTHWWFNG
jgi:hypothetical protein